MLNHNLSVGSLQKTINTKMDYYPNYRPDETMNLGEYRDTKDMERIMLSKMNTYSSVTCKGADELRIEERINKIRKLRRKLMKPSAFDKIVLIVKDIF